MPKPLITELPAAARAPQHLPAPGEEARRGLDELPVALRRTAHVARPALDEATIRAHFADLAALGSPDWPGAAAARRAVGLDGLGALHPQQPSQTLQGALEIIHEVARALAAIAGLGRFSLQPPCISVAERAAVRLAVASFARTEQARTEVVATEDCGSLARAREMGLVVHPIGRLASGDVDLEALEGAVGLATALVATSWLTPAGRLDRNLAAAGQVAHVHGALLGVDATGLARLAGHASLREVEADIAWLWLSELCPAAKGAALGVRSTLTQYLPSPLVGKDREGYCLDDELPVSVGPLALTTAPLADALLLYVTLRYLGEAGLRQRAAEMANGVASQGQ